jgi:cysteine desulfurase / selenocysteine lyase
MIPGQQSTLDKERLRREQFPVTRQLVYLSHAAVGPLSTRAFEAMRAHAENQLLRGATDWREWYDEYARFRGTAARLLNCTAGEISILKNTSEGLAFAAEGLDWRDGDNVITTDLEFPSNASPWKALERRGVECRVIRSTDGIYAAADAERLMDDRTRILTVSSAAFHNGFAPDLVELGALCRDRGVLFCVDAIQTLGAIPLDVRVANISFLAADGHKWMLGPEGCAIFYCAAEVRERLRVLEYGWTNLRRRPSFLEMTTDLIGDGRRFEAGSLNTNGIYGLRASLELFEEIGRDAVAAEVLRIAGHLASRLEDIGWAVQTPRPVRSGIIAATPPFVEPGIAELHRLLEQRGIICSPREGMLRLAPHFYNDESDVERVVEALGELGASELGASS